MLGKVNAGGRDEPHLGRLPASFGPDFKDVQEQRAGAGIGIAHLDAPGAARRLQAPLARVVILRRGLEGVAQAS